MQVVLKIAGFKNDMAPTELNDERRRLDEIQMRGPNLMEGDISSSIVLEPQNVQRPERFVEGPFLVSITRLLTDPIVNKV